MKKNPSIFQRIPFPLAAAAGWLVPGLGHVLIGRWKRGIILFLVITATFWTGVAIGGTMTMDSRYEKWWKFAQLGAGANGLIAWARQDSVYDELLEDDRIDALIKGNIDKAQADNDRRLAAGIKTKRLPPHDIIPAPGGRPDALQMTVDQHLANWPNGSIVLANPSDNLARSYTGIIGLMNILCVFDVIMLGMLGVRGETGKEDEA